MIELNTPNKLPPKVKWYNLTKIILLILVASFPFLLINKGAWFLGFFLFFVFFVGLPAFVYFLLCYKFLTFIVENDRITINSGIIIKRSKSIPFDKIQNVDNVRGILARLFGISEVNIWTSSPEQIQVYQKETVHKPAGSLELNVADGERLKNFILSKRS